MNWADEHYVKLFTRDTVTWRSWPWQARALFPLLMRAVDGAGMLSVGTRELGRSVALMVDLPADVVTPGIEALLADGTVELSSAGVMIITKFLEAQESRKTNAQSKREQREGEKSRARLAEVRESSTQHRQTAADGGRSGHPPALPCPALPRKDVPRTEPKPRKLSAAQELLAWLIATRASKTLLTEAPVSVVLANKKFGEALTQFGRPACERAYLAFLELPEPGAMDPPWPWQSFLKRLPMLAARQPSTAPKARVVTESDDLYADPLESANG